MTNSNKKLKLDISGRFQKLWTELFLRRRAKALGLNIHGVKHPSFSKSELVLSGDMISLWKFVKSSKSPAFFIRIEKLEFHFVD